MHVIEHQAEARPVQLVDVGDARKGIGSIVVLADVPAPEEPVLVAEGVVHTAGVGVVLAQDVAGPVEVVAAVYRPRLVRRRIVAQDLGRDRADAAGGNDIAG